MTVPLTGSWLERPWGRMRVWTAGEGPPVLAVHGLGGSGRYWQALADAVERTVIAPDLGGFGSSDKPPIAYDRAFHLASLDAVVDAFAPGGPLVVVGHSIGGTLAAMWAGRHADRVAALALAAAPYPTARGFDPSRMPTTPMKGRRAVEAATRVLWPVLAVPVGLVRGYSPAMTTDFGRQTRLAHVWTLGSVLHDPSVTQDIAPVAQLDGTSRILILYATDDRRVRAVSQQRWRDLLPHAAERVVASGGHQFLLRSGFSMLGDWLETG